MTRIADIVELRPEVTEGDLHGIISLHDIISTDENAFEKDSARVLAATYPSQSIRQLLMRLETAMAAKMADRKGLFLIHGGYGTGKSHLLCVLYHLLNSPLYGKEWASVHGISFKPQSDSSVILMPMTNLQDPDTGRTVEYLWKPIFQHLGYTGFEHTGNNWPTTEDMKKAVTGKRVVVIIDELERWFLPISDPHVRQANITFLQNFSEFASNPDNGYIAIFTLLGIDAEVTDILQRPDRFQDDLTGAPDRRQVALHRLVESVDPAKASAIVDSYLDAYKPVADEMRLGDMNRLRDEMIRSYPFHPGTLDVVFQRYSSVARQDDRSYQNSRGALMLLAHVLQQSLDSFGGEAGSLRDRDLLLPGDISLSIDTVSDDLAMLNAELTHKARENLQESQHLDLAAPVVSVALLHSLGDPKEERALGARWEDVLSACIRPANGSRSAVSSGIVEMAITQIVDSAINLHTEQNPVRWVFRPQVNIATQVNRRAASIKNEVAHEIIVQELRDLLDARDVVIHPMDPLPNDRHVYIVLTTTRAAEHQEILDTIYHGRAFANGFIIVEPRDFGSILDDTTLLHAAKRAKAADLLRSNIIGDAQGRRELKDIEDRYHGILQQRLRDRYGAWRQPVFDDGLGNYSFVRVDVSLGRLKLFQTVAGRYSAAAYKEAVLQSITEIHKGVPPTVDQVRMDFYQQRSYPKPVVEDSANEERIDQAIKELIQSADIEVIDKGDGHFVCGANPGTLQKNWQLQIAPDEHKPRFVLVDQISAFLKINPMGVTMDSVREHSKKAAGVYVVTVKDKEIDLAVIQLFAEGKVTLGNLTAAPPVPLSPSLVVTLRGKETLPKNALTIGPATVANAKTQVISLVNKPDRLRKVRVVVRTVMGGQNGLDEARAYLPSLPDAKALPGTKWTAECTLEDAPVANRQQLVDILNTLPARDETTVEISLERGVTPTGGEE